MTLGPLYDAGFVDGVKAERERCAKICEAQRSSERPIVAPLTNAAYDEACRDCAAAILEDDEDHMRCCGTVEPQYTCPETVK